MLGVDPVVMVAGMSLLALLPFIAVMVTSYVKLVVVFSLVRNALGIQQIPPNMVMNSMAVLLSVFIMAPIGTAMYDAAKENGLIHARGLGEVKVEQIEQAVEPLRAFLLKHSHQSMRDMFVGAAAMLAGDRPSDSTRTDAEGILILGPAFMLSELTEAFQIGFVLYLPFIVVDLIVSNILLAMGMMMVSPMTISLPFKLLLFVMIDGWAKIINGLLATYR